MSFTLCLTKRSAERAVVTTNTADLSQARAWAIIISTALFTVKIMTTLTSTTSVEDASATGVYALPERFRGQQVRWSGYIISGCQKTNLTFSWQTCCNKITWRPKTCYSYTILQPTFTQLEIWENDGDRKKKQWVGCMNAHNYTACPCMSISVLVGKGHLDSLASPIRWWFSWKS